MYASKVAARILKLTDRRDRLIADAAGRGAKALADLAVEVSYLDGKIDGLEDVIEDATGQTATAELVAELAARG